jgi:hypothetical protein
MAKTLEFFYFFIFLFLPWGVVQPPPMAITLEFFYFYFPCHGVVEPPRGGWFGHPRPVNRVAPLAKMGVATPLLFVFFLKKVFNIFLIF